MLSVEQLLKRCAEQYADKLAVCDERNEITYADLWNAARGFASFLGGLGLPKGARILIRAIPAIPTMIAYYGIHLAGFVNVPCEATAGPETLAGIAGETQASLIIADIELPEGCRRLDYAQIRALADEHFTPDAVFEDPDPETVCDILFTTGTTGKSKGVMISIRALAASSENQIVCSHLSDKTVYLIPVPINHANGIRKAYATVCGGGTLVLVDGLSNIRRFYAALEKYKANYLLLPPSAVRMLLLLSSKQLAKYADQIEHVHTSAAPFPEADKQRLKKLLPKSRLMFGYGASEAASVSMLEYSKYPDRICCVGALNLHSKVKIVDETGAEIASSKNHQGTIILGGEGVMTGYYNAPELTADVLKDGWVRTNDIGYFDEDGFLYVLGRADDVINVGGLKIAPTEVENVVMQYAGIAECACFGIDDPTVGKLPKLIIVPERNAEIDTADLCAFLESKMETYKVPKKIEIVSEIPKTSNGKINRKILK